MAGRQEVLLFYGGARCCVTRDFACGVGCGWDRRVAALEVSSSGLL